MHHYYKSFSSLGRLLTLGAAGLITQLMPFSQAGAQTPNIDFNSGNFSNWTCWVGHSSPGTAATGSFFDSATISSPIGGHVPGIDPATGIPYVNASRHAITSGSDTDFYGGFPIVCPGGGTHSLRLGNDSANFRSDRVQYYVHVPAGTTSFNLQCQYAIVMQYPPHQASEQPTFQVTAYDSATGTILPSANNLYVARYNVPGFVYAKPPSYGYYGLDSIFYLPWTASTINLSGMGGKTVTLECSALDCAQGGHWGYGYFDVTAVQDSLVASLLRYSTSGDSVVLQGPPGYKYYHWQNQNLTLALNGTTDTARTKTLPTPATKQYYNLTLTPFDVNGVPVTIHSPVLKAKPLGVSGAQLATVVTYPNPSNTVLNISFHSLFDGTVSLTNAQGQVVYMQEITGRTQFAIPTSDISAGVYRLLIQEKEGAGKTITISIKH